MFHRLERHLKPFKNYFIAYSNWWRIYVDDFANDVTIGIVTRITFNNVLSI